MLHLVERVQGVEVLEGGAGARDIDKLQRFLNCYLKELGDNNDNDEESL